ncbi:MAG: 50S ribosomal protein L4 [Candidatus Taylorbacteria bacterium]|nr:50S ribosomal protein L4 [Candidatus Taylorbacteria bacterium]
MAKKTTKESTEKLEVKVYDQSGKAVSDVSLPTNIFGLPKNADLVHQVVTSMESSAREPIAHTKTRGEVRGGGKKPWQQKGTGRARHGSSRSPIWVGGGVAHGPRNDKNYNRKVNKKMKAKAIYTILSEKLRDGEALFLNALTLENPKTTEAKSVLSKLGTIKGYEAVSTRRNNAALILVPELTQNVKLGFRNMGNVEVIETRNVNPVTLLQYKFVVVTNPEAAIITLDSKMK